MPPTSSSLRSLFAWWFALAAVVSSTGCATLLGDFDVTRGDAGAELTTVCKPSDHRCDHDLLLGCNAAQNGWEIVEACRAPALCDARGGRCATCNLGDYQCSDANLQSCNPKRDKWDDTTCPTRDLCNLNTQACRACDPGDHQCRGAVIEVCGSDFKWTTEHTCATPELCDSQNRTAARCLEPVCDNPGKHLCDGKRLLRCAPGRDQRIPIEDCASTALCDAAQADADNAARRLAHCKQPTCAPDSWSCEGPTLRQCNADGTAYLTKMVCAAGTPCNAKAKNCSTCAAGEFVCEGASLLQCVSGAWTLSKACTSAALCNAAARQCNFPDCSPAAVGTAKCDRTTNNSVLVCTAGLTNVAVGTPCVTSALCDPLAARCDPPVCNQGAIRCGVQNRLQHCDDNTREWVDDVTPACPAETPCSLPDGLCKPCQPGEARCNDTYLEICTSQGWERKDHCASKELCDALGTRSCVPPICRAGEFRCDGPALMVCNPARNKFDEFRTCAANTCDAATGSCKCAPTDTACSER